VAIIPIITGAESPILREKTQKVNAFDKKLQKLATDLTDTAVQAKGAGLAAPQVGVTSAICVARVAGSFIPLVNPEVIWQSDHTVTGEEGCLSLPNVWLYVPRPTEVIIHFQDIKGKEQERKLTGWDSRVVQHEIDHLNGILITDYKGEGAKEPAQAL